MATAVRLACVFVATAVAAPTLALAQWAPQGTPVGMATRAQNKVVLASDGAGGAIIAWVDYRHSFTHLILPEVYVQRLDGHGLAQWAAYGVRPCADSCLVDPFDGSIQILPTASGGALLSWLGRGRIFAQRIDATGAFEWSPKGVPLSTNGNWLWGSWSVPSDSGGAILGWNWAPLDCCGSVSIARIAGDGLERWFDSSIAPSTSWARNSVGVADGSGGAMVAWLRNLNSGVDVRAQRFDRDGAPQWTGDIALSIESGAESELAGTSDGQGGAWFTWRTYRLWDRIVALHVGPMGTLPPYVDGVELSTTGTPQLHAAPASDGNGGVIVLWEDLRGADADIYAQRLDAAGQRLWADPGVPICAANGRQAVPKVIPDGSGGIIAVWSDERNASVDLYAQRVDANGSTLWTANGVPLCTATGDQYEASLVSDGAGGAIIAWRDGRRDAGDIYAQRVTSDGTIGPLVSVEPRVPSSLRLLAPQPNPARGATTFALELPRAQRLRIEVLDVHGRRVRRLADGDLFVAGRNEFTWDGRDDHARVAPGVYLVRVWASGETVEGRVVVLK